MSNFPDLVVLIPGITGSVLVNAAGDDIWKLSANTLWRVITDSAQAAADLILNDSAGDDGITAQALIPDLRMIPGFVKIDGYTRIANFLVDELGLVRGENFHEFPYDWRRDNRVSAQRLRDQALAWLHDWRKQPGREVARLILIGHSMGGLVARYFFECLEGWRDIRLIMTLGTPYSGSMRALGFLEHGMKGSIGPLGVDLSPAVRSMPSVYQLLPTYRCIAIDGGQLLHVHEAAKKGLLLHVDEHRAIEAKAFHEEINEAALANRRLAGYPDGASTLLPFVGIQQPTAQSAIWTSTGLKLVDALQGRDDGGDGTVPRVSAAPPGWNHRHNVYAGETHGALQNADSILVNIKGFAVKPAVDVRQFLSATTPALLSLDFDDVVPAGGKLTVRARRSSGNAPVFAELVRRDSDERQSAMLVRDGATGWQHGLFDLAPGVWQVTVRSDGAEAVHDFAVVAQL